MSCREGGNRNVMYYLTNPNQQFNSSNGVVFDHLPHHRQNHHSHGNVDSSPGESKQCWIKLQYYKRTYTINQHIHFLFFFILSKNKTVITHRYFQ